MFMFTLALPPVGRNFSGGDLKKRDPPRPGGVSMRADSHARFYFISIVEALCTPQPTTAPTSGAIQ